MGEAFITRRGGTAVGTAAPSINFVSSTFDSITFTITNNDALTADIFWEIGDSTPDANTLSLAGGATSSNQVASGLDEETSYTIFAFANAEGKAGSQTSSIAQTTPAVPIIYTAATGGTTAEYDSGGKRFKSHTFTSDGTFTVTTAGNVDRNQVDYLIIAGGGAGGRSEPAGGGGAGGFRTTITPVPSNQTADSKITVTATSYSVVVGSGGTASASTAVGQKGSDSSVFSITSEGGGGGGIEGTAGANGGSGGGSGFSGSSAGTGILGQGRNGGSASTGSPNFPGSGGGGAGAVGQNATNSKAGDGGAGLANTLRDGTSETRAGGGGGAQENANTPLGEGGIGGGGNGSTGSVNGQNGTANTGGGGGGADIPLRTSGSGGSGIVIIRYEIAPSV